MNTQRLAETLNAGGWVLGGPSRLHQTHTSERRADDPNRVIQATLSDDGKILHLEFLDAPSRVIALGGDAVISSSCLTITQPIPGNITPHDEFIDVTQVPQTSAASFVHPEHRRDNTRLQQSLAG